jgi:hypothetical protein
MRRGPNQTFVLCRGLAVRRVYEEGRVRLLIAVTVVEVLAVVLFLLWVGLKW